jgi:hypothetical protein
LITPQHAQECLSRAFVHAVGGSAGINFHLGNVFDYGFDGQFRPVALRGNRHVDSGFPVDFQLKATTDWKHVGDKVVYDVEAKTYNDLVGRDSAGVGAILILLCMPKDSANWVAFFEDELRLRHCCYWERLQGTPTSNTQTKRILIPRSNLLNATNLHQLLVDERVRRMGSPA